MTTTPEVRKPLTPPGYCPECGEANGHIGQGHCLQMALEAAEREADERHDIAQVELDPDRYNEDE